MILTLVFLLSFTFAKKSACQCVTYRDETDPTGQTSTTYCNVTEPVQDRSNFKQSFDEPPITPTMLRNVKFYRWNSHTNDQELIRSNAQLNPFNLTVIIHGYTGSADTWKQAPHRNLISALRFIKPRSDIMFVSWPVEASPYGGDWFRFWRLDKLYGAAALNTKPVAKIAARFLERPEAKIDLSSTHCIGFSLGAHVCGFLGKSLTTGKLGRITGLDPAGLGFDTPFANDRLDENDAAFVDVYHSSKQLGLLRAIGHLDFYINDPTRPQPECVKNLEETSDGPTVIEMPSSLLFRKRRGNLGQEIDGWKHFIGTFVKGIEWAHNDDVVSYLTGSPYGFSNQENVGDIALSGLQRHVGNRVAEAKLNICAHYLVIDLYTSSIVPSCRMEFCSCLSYISTQHEAFFQRQLEANCHPQFCSDWRHRFLFGYYAQPPRSENQRYLYGDGQCGAWPLESSFDDDGHIETQLDLQQLF